MGDEIEDSFIDNDLDILGGVIDNTPIGDSIPSTGNFSSLTSQNGLFFDGGDNFLQMMNYYYWTVPCLEKHLKIKSS